MLPKTYIFSFLICAACLLALVAIANLIIDPFNEHGGIRDPALATAAYSTNPWIFRAIGFRRSSTDQAMFGDSTIAQLTPVTGNDVQPIFNFGIGGSEIFDTLAAAKYAASRKPSLRIEYIGVSEYRMTDARDDNLFQPNVAIADDPFAMALSATTLQASLAVVREKLSGPSNHKISDDNRGLIAKQIMTALVTVGSEKSIRARRSIEDTICALQKRGVTVAILVPPASPELQGAIRTKFPAKDASFKNWIRTLPLVIDYNVPSKITAVDSHFRDALHLTHTWASVVLSDLASGAHHYAHVYTNKNDAFCK